MAFPNFVARVVICSWYLSIIQNIERFQTAISCKRNQSRQACVKLETDLVIKFSD